MSEDVLISRDTRPSLNTIISNCKRRAPEASSNLQRIYSGYNFGRNDLTAASYTFSEDRKIENVSFTALTSAQIAIHIMSVSAISKNIDGEPTTEDLLNNTSISADLKVGGKSTMNLSKTFNATNNSVQVSQVTSNFTCRSNSHNNSSNVVRNSVSTSNGRNVKGHTFGGRSCRFPKLEDCAHFHYERVQLGPLSVRLSDDKTELLNNSIASQSIGGDIANVHNVPSGLGHGSQSVRSFCPANCWFILKVLPHQCEPFLIKRSLENIKMLDEMLHRCVYDRKISGLKNFNEIDFKTDEDVEYAVTKYLQRFSKIASDSLTCGTILTWLQLDNKGRRLPLADGETQRTINTPAVGAAYGVRRYQAQAADEISIEVGDMISVIDMPSPAESIWWRGKKSHLQKSQYEVGFFPQSCVATIGDKVPRHFPMPAPLVGQLDVSPTKPVLRKHGKLIAFFRSFILSRPSRRRLKQSGIYRERVFSCDLSEHLLNSGQDIPMVLKCCAEFIEEYGIVDGIYRLSGITSNIQRLRRAFDEERIPDLSNPETKQDIHAISSLLKMYFRELPNPLCTYQLYDNFVEAIQSKAESSERLRLMKETVLKLPPPHFRTLKYLAEHLNKISQYAPKTGMTDKNLAIVWAPNLLRSPVLESGGVAALRGVGVQAVVTEYLIRNCHNIFDAIEECNARLSFITPLGNPISGAELRLDSLTDCESLLVEQREHDQSLMVFERPKSLNTGGPKLISLEEAQERHSRIDGIDGKHSMPINMIASNTVNIGSYIEVGGGPSSLPDKYHTVLSMPRNWQKRKTHSWKSLFTRNQQRSVNGNCSHDFQNVPGKSFNTTSTSLQRKEVIQVTFADAASIIGNSDIGHKSVLLKKEKPKSIELYETKRETNKQFEPCGRSNSIDSIRTTGHSRSVSHDSYFDMLQSPQRSCTNYPSSKEFSELGLNFDREEPEMHIFSESESLVSSPRVGKENVPPSISSTRRVMRARPEEFSSQTNSVNPSPKKQPRLNLLSPTKSPDSQQKINWINNADALNSVTDQLQPNIDSDENGCKRYKLEDQLSDIQYIDSGTPEYGTSNSSNFHIYGQTQKPLNTDDVECRTVKIVQGTGATPVQESLSNAGLFIKTRYSYPSMHLVSKRKNNEQRPKSQDRFSYHGPLENQELRDRQLKIHLDEQSNSLQEFININSFNFSKMPVKYVDKDHITSEVVYSKNRKSMDGNNESLNLQNSEINFTDVRNEIKNDRKPDTKLVVTPISSINSPRYSLLVGETSSENSSVLNTPQYELEPLMIGSALSGISRASDNSLNHHQLLILDEPNSCAGNCDELFSRNASNVSNEQCDIFTLKRVLSLDVKPFNIAYPTDNATKNQHLKASPNNSILTDNSSQSITPSEFGYQYLQKQLSMHSLIETDENSTAYEAYNRTTSNLSSSNSLSPIKSTISITYNIRSPNISNLRKPSKPLLETCFDENFIYEKVKLLRNSVTEVNQILNSNRKVQSVNDLSDSNDVILVKNSIPEPLKIYTKNENGVTIVTKALGLKENYCNKFMYQNLLLRKPQSVYENFKAENEALREKNSSNFETGSYSEIEEILSNVKNVHNSEQSLNFNVKALANKFEKSPIDQTPSIKIDKSVSVRNSIRNLNTYSSNDVQSDTRNCQSYVTQHCKLAPMKKFAKSQQITRSLDENTFLREFGVTNLKDLSLYNAQILTESSDANNRRKSFDFTRPKMLNPPKRLPGIPHTGKQCMKSDLKETKIAAKSDILKHDSSQESAEFKKNTTEKEVVSVLHDKACNTVFDFRNCNVNHTTSCIKVLSGFKLDRERIDRIKEERRQQLTQKYHSDSIKSHSKTELNTGSTDDDKRFTTESLRVKSKSRVDIPNIQRNIDKSKELSRSTANVHLSSEVLLGSHTCSSYSMPSTSEEKNQNFDSSLEKGEYASVELIGSANLASTLKTSNTLNVKAEVSSTVQKEDKKLTFIQSGSSGSRERKMYSNKDNISNLFVNNRQSVATTREKISPQFSIRDVTAMFESRSQNQ